MRIGLVGCGSIGTRHAKNVKALGHEIVSVDRDATRSRDWNPCYDLEDFAQSRPSAVLICTPASTHADIATALLAVGYSGPLFVEKPLALTSKECAIFREWPSVVNMTGYNWRFHPQVLQWKADVTPFTQWDYAVLECDTDLTLWPGREYADPVFECSHEIDTATWMGAPLEIKRAGYLQQESGFNLTLGNVHVQMRWDRAKPKRKFSVNRACESLKEKRCCWCQSHDYFPVVMNDSIYVDISYKREIEHFLRCVEEGTPTITPFADGIRVVQLCEDALKLAAAHV